MEKMNNKKILIVDDNPKNLQVAMNILKDYSVIYAQSGEKALELVKENDFDLILLDIIMPTLSGYEVCKIIKEDEKTKDIPLIFLTVKDEEKDIVEGFNLGAVDYLTKPFQPEVLLKRVEIHLKLSSTINEVNLLNSNLTDIVKKQIEDIREKDKILIKQSKMVAISEMVDMMIEQIIYPLGLIKMQNQGLEIKLLSGNLVDDDILSAIKITNEQLTNFDITIEDFKNFFRQDARADDVNLNLMINSTLLFFKDIFIKDKIDVNINGNMGLTVSFVKSELKHILLKILFNILNLIKEKKLSSKNLNFIIESKGDFVELKIESGIEGIDDKFIENVLNSDEIELEDSSTNHLGLHLVKILIEKNDASLSIKNENNMLSYIVRFNK